MSFTLLFSKTFRCSLAVRSAWLCSAVVLSAACATPAPAPAKEPKAAKVPAKAPVKKTLAEVGLEAAALDRSANPCDDFYRFACGGWIDKTTIPADKPRWVRSFSVIHKRNEADLKALLEQAAKQKEGDAGVAKLGAFFRACMDKASIDKGKLAPLKKILARIRRIKTSAQLMAAIRELHGQQVWAFFSITGDQDYGDATRNIAHLDQAGLGLPDRDYYLNEAKKAKEIRKGYQAHVERLLRLAGFSKRRAAVAAVEVLAVETALAKVSMSKVDRRDPRKMYNKRDRKGLAADAPKVAWKAYLAALKLAGVEDFNVSSPAFFKGLSKLLASKKPRAFRSYLTWQLLHTYAPALSEDFVKEGFALQKLLTGQKAQRPRWKRCVAATDQALGELLAQSFVAKRFAGDSKTTVTQMVHAIGAAFGKLLGELPWLDDATRAKAHEKRKKMAYLIGYPERWRQYPFAVGASFAANVRAAQAHELARRLGRIGKPVDPKEWEMSPPTVNAYYHPSKNHMVFPAGILQPPFFDSKAAVAVNMGAMGMVVGHELTHGFDDQGSRFDAFGNLKNWWGPEVRKRFEKRTQCMIAQYDGYEPLPGVKLNGKLTLGENIADAGGVKLAFRAYRALTAKARPVEAEGFTQDQLFFLSAAQIWCAKARPSFSRMRAKTDPHSAPRFRVMGSLSNTSEFAEAFQCKAGAKMAPKKRCEVW